MGVRTGSFGSSEVFRSIRESYLLITSRRGYFSKFHILIETYNFYLIEFFLVLLRGYN